MPHFQVLRDFTKGLYKKKKNGNLFANMTLNGIFDQPNT